jgi:putative restriction endonuclease
VFGDRESNPLPRHPHLPYNRFINILSTLQKLNPASNRKLGSGPERFAPHKPLLLLSIIDLVEHHLLTTPELILSPTLRVRFQSFAPIVSPRWRTSRLDIRYPLYYLKTQGLWLPKDAQGRPARAPESVQSADLHPEFWNALQDPSLRRSARLILITTYFPALEQLALAEALGLSSVDILQHRNSNSEKTQAARQTGRSARFRYEVLSGYSFTCALTGRSLTTASGSIMIEAAHIKPFRLTRDNHPTNGLALTPDAHWAFDEGLWTIEYSHSTKQYLVQVATRSFVESGPGGQWLSIMHHQPLIFAAKTSLRPNPTACADHQNQIFLG